MARIHGVMIGRRANGNCVICQNKTRHNRYSYCSAFGEGTTEAIKKYFRCKHHTDPGDEGNAFKMIKGMTWEKCHAKK